MAFIFIYFDVSYHLNLIKLLYSPNFILFTWRLKNMKNILSILYGFIWNSWYDCIREFWLLYLSFFLLFYPKFSLLRTSYRKCWPFKLILHPIFLRQRNWLICCDNTIDNFLFTFVSAWWAWFSITFVF